MTETSVRLALPYPENTDAPDGPAQIKALVDRLVEIIVGYQSGDANDRPATPDAWTIYFSTDTGAITYYDGSDWNDWFVQLPEDGPADTSTMRTLGPGNRQAAPGNDSRFERSDTQQITNRSTRNATTAFVLDVLDTLIGGAPSNLNTFGEIANVLSDKLNRTRPNSGQIASGISSTQRAWAPRDVVSAISQHDAGSVDGFSIWSGTQMEYDSIQNLSSTTLYFIE